MVDKITEEQAAEFRERAKLTREALDNLRADLRSHVADPVDNPPERYLDAVEQAFFVMDLCGANTTPLLDYDVNLVRLVGHILIANAISGVDKPKA